VNSTAHPDRQRAAPVTDVDGTRPALVIQAVRRRAHLIGDVARDVVLDVRDVPAAPIDLGEEARLDVREDAVDAMIVDERTARATVGVLVREEADLVRP
jgi:hypothetical protein